ncbi:MULTISPECIES: dynamin family protein [unclassified Microcoleus]|uniref:dynamin family protein n=1 Tax=unclassified Microcoleus TaxID=2642155 RepID=UPI002FD5AE6D
MSTDRATQVANIIKQRQGLITNIKTAEKNIKNLLSSLRQLEVKRQEIIPQVREAGASVSLETIKLERLINKLEAEYEKFKNLKTRFSNSTLNIGVVGRMGQGKSTLLQSLTGLPDDVIPARQGKACTAARSTICHRSEREIEAVVTFHTEKSFLKEVILPYFKKLNLTRKLDNIDDFANYKFTEISNSLVEGATDETMYERLYKDYYLGLGGYRTLLNQPPQTVTREEIKKYVSQDRDSKNNLIDYKHLAVRNVRIFCNFPKADIGQIALVDVPGMGDFKLGDEKLMLETLGKEVDVVLFVSKPGDDRYGWITQDTNLYDQATTALNDLADRAFMVLNLHSTGNNRNGCDSQKADVDNRNVRMQFAKPCIIANCSNDNANNKVFEPVLKYLETEITELDKKYAYTCQQRIVELHEQVKNELNKAGEVLQQFANERKQFDEYFTGKSGDSGLWLEIQKGLGKLLYQLRDKRETEDPTFKERVEQTIASCRSDTGIPLVQEIEDRQNVKGREQGLYFRYLEEVRAHLSRQFLSLDCDLQQSLEAVKSEVKKVLAEDGRLKKLSNSEGSVFFMEIATQLPDISESNLRLGFKKIGELNLSFSGRIQRLIRPHLDILVPKRNTSVTSSIVQEEVKNLGTTSNNSESQEVYNRLKHTHELVVKACEAELNKLYFEPNQVAYYMVEDFLDRVLYAKGIEKEWDYFLWEKRQQVWHEFKLLGERIKVKQEWGILINQAKSANKLDLLRFLD